MRYLQAVGLVAHVCAVAICSAGEVRAHTSITVELTCPYDDTKFSFVAQASGTSFGTTLDFRPVGPIVSPDPIGDCPTNGFVFFEHQFSGDKLERMRPFILSADYQALRAETSYYRAAWIAERTGTAHFDASMLLLQATWQVYEDLPRYQRYATELAARLPDDIKPLTGPKKRWAEFLLGEVLRRLGRLDEARLIFSALVENAEANATEVAIARFQLRLIGANDRQPHLMHEAAEAANTAPSTAPQRQQGRP